MADADSRAGARYADAAILDWTAKVHSPHDEGLDAAFTAPERAGMPAIQVGQSEGALLGFLLRMVSARVVVEVGTLAGYSAIHMARAVGEGGHVHTIENDAAHARVAREAIASAGVADRVTVHEGPGVEVLETLRDRGPFCAVFVDADKGGYPEYGRFAAAHLRPGGLLIGDNVYLFGRLLQTDDPTAANMRKFHEEMANAFDSVCIPTPDGLAVGRKLPVPT